MGGRWKKGREEREKGELDEERGVECGSIMEMERKIEMVKEIERWLVSQSGKEPEYDYL